MVVTPGVRARPQGAKASQGEAQQPDKTLYDTAVSDIQRKRFIEARMLLSTLINTYDSSEFLAKAHLAVAESWYKQGGERGLAQAQDECRQLISLYPDGPEAKAGLAMLQEIQTAERGKAAPAR